LLAALMAGAASFSWGVASLLLLRGDGSGQRIGAGGGLVGASLGAHAGRFGLDASAGAAVGRAGIGLHGNVGLFADSAVGRCVAGWAGVATVAASSFGRAVVVPAGAAVLLSGVASVLAVLLPLCACLRAVLKLAGRSALSLALSCGSVVASSTGASAAALAAPLATSATTALAAGSAASTSGALWALSTTAAVAALALASASAAGQRWPAG
jgi:hypothetical protein